MPLQRQRYWDSRAFPSFLQVRRRKPFIWGANDCLMFAADGLLAICGGEAGGAIDVAAGFRGQYLDAEGAIATMKAMTGTLDMLTAVGVIAGRFGLKKRPVAYTAQRGDVVLVEDAGRLICALVGLSGRWVHAPGDAGLRNLCITDVRHAWTY